MVQHLKKMQRLDDSPSGPGTRPDSDPAQTLRQRLQGVNLYLIGMMGSGKSAVGRPLAEALGYRFLDADISLEQVAEGRSRSCSTARESRASAPWKRRF
jgi:ATP-dependent protease Clp ATPase subunit